ISGDNIVWNVDTTKGMTIFLDDGQNIIQLNNENSSNTWPKIFGDNVAWTTHDPDKKTELFLYNGEETIQVSQNLYQHIYRFQISEDNVVWTALDSTGKKQIFLYDSEKTIQISGNDKTKNYSSSVKIKKDIWQDKLSSPENKTFFNYSKKTIQLGRIMNDIFGGDTNYYDPQISGKNVIWKSERNLFLYNGRESIKLDNKGKDVYGSSLKISGNNIVWKADDSDGDKEIFFHGGEGTIQLTNNNVIDYAPQISGHNTVWVNGGNPSSEIFFSNGTEVLQITNNNTNDVLPYIDGNNIVWLNKDELITSVMLATFNDTKSSSTPQSDRPTQIMNTSAILVLGLIFVYLCQKLIANS
ncbi:MAG: hypothetical protein AAGM29_14890, partial [Cyanobacteria bacterium J06588_4]